MPFPPSPEQIRWEQRQAILGGPPAMLESLLESPAFPAWLLHEAAAHPRPEIRALVASHPEARTDTLGLLAGDHDVEVRRAVARASRTSLLTLKQLLRDEDAEVRAGAAAHPRMDDDVAVRPLLGDEDARVRQGVVRAVRFRRRQHWLSLLVDDPSPQVRAELAGSAWASPAILVALSRDPAPEVRRRAAPHPDLPRVELERLLADPSPEVARAAAARDRECQECLRSGRGESLWRLLVACWGPPAPVSRWPDGDPERLVCFEARRDGYGGGSLQCRRARPEDLEATQDHMLSRVVYAFPGPVGARDWQERIEDPGWERLGDIPFLP